LNSNPSSSAETDLDPQSLPVHIAVIMDGNGRWAKKRFLNRIKGHEKGSETVRSVVRTCREIGIRVLTLYAFSTENWQRPKSEIIALMALLKKFLISERKEMSDNNIRLNAIISKHLYTGTMPDPDLLIRTSGEMRISNFLLWQIAYTEICVTDTLWPDFGKDELLQILKNYQERERRFGKVET
jgi:undecaprenyl pyrophosphate synthase